MLHFFFFFLHSHFFFYMHFFLVTHNLQQRPSWLEIVGPVLMSQFCCAVFSLPLQLVCRRPVSMNHICICIICAFYLHTYVHLCTSFCCFKGFPMTVLFVFYGDILHERFHVLVSVHIEGMIEEMFWLLIVPFNQMVFIYFV